MSNTTHHSKARYYAITVSSYDGSKLLASNNERAFVVSQLQDLLNARSFLEEPFVQRRLAHHIDLLAFSLLPYSMQFVAFAISPQSADMFSSIIIERLRQYQSDQSVTPLPAPIVQIKTLVGPHEALQATLSLHRAHKDWEYDRYSSIGFYLHDRRGTWMRVWRLTHLYDNRPEHYLDLIQQSATLVHA
jgi:hypothetical protein